MITHKLFKNVKYAKPLMPGSDKKFTYTLTNLQLLA